MVQLIVLLCSLASASKMVEYKFRKNYGQAFYDYSGNLRHGVNGQTLSVESYDTIPTDRGAYFKSYGSITLPSNPACATGFTIPSTFSIVFWLYVTSTDTNDLTIFSRLSSNSNYFFIISRKDDNNYIRGHFKLNSFDSGTQYGSNNGFDKNIWVLISIVTTGSNAIFYENAISSLTINLGTSYVETGTYTTYIGTTSSSPCFFIWYFVIFGTNITPGNFVSTATSSACLTSSGSCDCTNNMCDTKFLDPDLGAGSMSSKISPTTNAFENNCSPASTTYGCTKSITLSCSCSSKSCEISDTNACQCRDLSNGALTSGTCSCQSGYTSSGSYCCGPQCSACGVNADVCTACVANNAVPDTTGCKCSNGYFGSAPLTSATACSACHPECATCSSYGPCLTCKATYATKITGGNGCTCNSGYQGTSPLNSEGSCYVCHIECLTCSSSTICTACKTTLASPDTTQGCKCNPGTYSTESPLTSAGACVACDSECLTCTEALKCTACQATLGVIHANQGCYCPVGTYTAITPRTTPSSCMACHQECSQCIESMKCTQCIAANTVIDATQGCKCAAGYYATSTPLSSPGLCAACHQECSHCSQALKCTACKASLANTDATQGCYCMAGTYSIEYPLVNSGSCVLCHNECSTCTEALKCTGCKATLGAIDQNEGCYCPDGTFTANTPQITASSCEACYQECSKCTQALKCTECKATLALIHGTQGCYCPTGTYTVSTPLTSAGSCAACHQDCSQCTEALKCTGCKASLAQIHPSQGCFCPTGTYSTGSPLIDPNSCVVCDSECITCTQALKCTGCIATLAAIDPIQGCYCPDGTYTGNTPQTAPNSCEACYQECSKCTQPLKCTECKATLALIHDTQGCYCPAGTYAASTPLISAGSCVACHQECSQCIEALKCTGCKATLAQIHPSQGCYCPSGTSATESPLLNPGGCFVCDSECSTCIEPLKCTGCIANLALIDPVQGCYCSDGTFAANTPKTTANSCVACDQECSKCTQALKCTECKATLALIDSTQGCYCPAETFIVSTPLISAGSCAQCYQECSSCIEALKCIACKALHGVVDPTQGCKCMSGYYASTAFLTTANSCTICHQECSQCIEALKCTHCKTTHAEISITEGCKCLIGYFALTTPLLSPNDCEICYSDCSSCDSANKCLTCKDTSKIPDTDIGCKCTPGFFNDSTGSCAACNVECSNCLSNFSCLTCKSNFTTISQENFCECIPGYYNISKSPTVCNKCPDDCKTCFNANLCITCNTVNANPTDQGTCVCPNNSSLVGNLCQCKEQYYMDRDLGINICKSCNSTCKTCLNNTACETCFDQETIDPTSKLCASKCKSNQVLLSGECRDCPSLCDSCNQTFNCTQCSENANEVENVCKCKTGFEIIKNKCTRKLFWPRLTVSSDNRLMINFTVSPITHLKLEDFQIKIGTDASYSISFIDKTISVYYFILTFTENLNSGVSVSIRILKNPFHGIDNSELGIYTLEGELKEFIYDKTLNKAFRANVEAAVKITVTASVCMGIVSNPGAAWVLINTLQLIAYMPINANPLTPTINDFCNSLGEYNIMPNIMDYIFDSNSSAEPYRNAKNIGLSTSVFWVNFGPTATVLLVLVVAWPFIYLISKVRLGRITIKFAKFLGNYRYSIFLRFLIQAYLDIGFFSLIQFKAVKYMQSIHNPVDGYINAVSATIGIVINIQICTLLTPVALFVCSYISKDRIFESPDTQYNKRFGSLFTEFKNNKGFFSTQYYTLFFLRRLVFLLVQVYLNNYPYVQVILNISFTMIALGFLIYYRPFKESHILVSTFASELCVIIVFSISVGFLYDISSNIISILENTIVFSVLGAMSVQFLVSVYSFYLSLKYFWDKIERLRAKEFLDKTQARASGR